MVPGPSPRPSPSTPATHVGPVQTRLPRWLVPGLLLSLVVAGCIGEVEQGRATSDLAPTGRDWNPAFVELRNVLEQQCVDCHSTTAPILTGDNEDVYETLLNHTVEECGDNALVDPSLPGMSALQQLSRRACRVSVPIECGTGPCDAKADHPFGSLLREGDALDTWVTSGAPLLDTQYATPTEEH